MCSLTFPVSSKWVVAVSEVSEKQARFGHLHLLRVRFALLGNWRTAEWLFLQRFVSNDFKVYH